MDLGPKPEPVIEPAEPAPGGPDALDPEPTGIVRDIRASDPTVPADGGLGVSSERVGHTGPGQSDTTGVKDTRPVTPDPIAPPGQSPGDIEDNPVGLAPKAGYPSADPRSGT